MTPEHAPETYVGLAADRAERLARNRGWRVVRCLPPGSIVTMEYLAGRINFEVEDEVVTRAWLG
ncbi:I78 family peptidase inhibitor [Streptomyces sp. NPDC094032]|uniref:I78 family peptidase inhibitor n=1 Tax=Streptomyces sp. NPDC094032 TaxID=3155308 RepID=UPI003326932D